MKLDATETKKDVKQSQADVVSRTEGKNEKRGSGTKKYGRANDRRMCILSGWS